MASILQSLYPYVPVWMQNVGISCYGLAWRRERLGGDFEQYVSGFRERDRWSADHMQDYVHRELRRVLLQSFKQVPYYRRVWSAAGIAESDLVKMTVTDLPKLPITPKQDLRSDPDALVAQDIIGREKLHRQHSSGSTGTPITLICSSADHRRFIAGREVRSFGWAGTSLRHARSTIGGRAIMPKGKGGPPFHRFNWVEQQVYFSAFHISPAHVPAYVEAFNHHRPRVLTGYAYSHYLLARMMCEQGISLGYEPEALVLSSEKLTLEMKAVMKKAFRARAFEEYGAVENCMLATECEAGSLHISPDFGIIELLDADGRPVPPGTEGRIVCTSLLKEAQPFIRYEIGDVGVASATGCVCGRNHLPVLQEIVGRLEDVVISRDGREMVRFHKIFLNLPNVMEGQVIQEALDRFTVKVVTKDGFGQSEEELIRHRFNEQLGSVDLRLERVSEIPRTERGKFRAVICKLPADQRPGFGGRKPSQ